MRYRRKNREQHQRVRLDSPRRIVVLTFLFFLLGGVLIGRLFQLQVLEKDQWVARAAGQQEVERSLFPKRGRIFLQDKASPGGRSPLATNRQFFFVYAIPKDIADPTRSAQLLAPLLALPEEELQKKFAKQDDPWEPVKHRVDEETAKAIDAVSIPGIAVLPEPRRYYPEKTLGSHLLGFVQFDGERERGQYGLEGYFDSVLSGKPGHFLVSRDARGTEILADIQSFDPAVDGSDLLLTIDRHIQFTACTALERAVVQNDAAGGSVVIMNPKTGAIRAMCSVPSFDPNQYSAVEDQFVFNNPLIFLDYEPGSTMKTMTMAAGLETGVIQPDSTYVDKGFVQLGKHVMRNSDFRAHGEQTMIEVLDKSLNTGAIHVARLMEKEEFRGFVEGFGFGKPTGIELATEVPGDVRSLAKQGEIYTATASFGQGITVTPLQLLAAYGAIANGGVLMKPYIVEEIRKPTGEREKKDPVMIRRVISERTATLLSGMLVSVVRGVHGKRADVPGYAVAGKTGTAQIAKKDGPGYEQGATIGSFVGFAPAHDPTFVMLTKIDRPKGVRFAESTAAPLFGEIAEFLLRYDQIPPET